MTDRPALITTVHDPEGRLWRGFREQRRLLAGYAAVYAFITEPTDRDLIAGLGDAGVGVAVGPTGIPGTGQRQVLAAAHAAGHDDLFVCDFDRWLHWAGAYPDELVDLPGRMRREHPDAWYVCLGRTERALSTHPAAQVLPETATNLALAAMTGMELDATAGAAWVRRKAAEVILQGSTVATKATDLEWPALTWRADPARLEGARLEGLEFETADGYPDEIAALGSLEAWMRVTYDRPRVLRDRLQLAADSISALMQVVGET